MFRNNSNGNNNANGNNNYNGNSNGNGANNDSDPGSMGNQTARSDNQLLQDFGSEPLIINMNRAARMNTYYRLALWTGSEMQVTLMSIKPGEDFGLDIHPDHDHLLYIVSGNGMAFMGSSRDTLDYSGRVTTGYSVIVPANTWHNVVNTGNSLLKMFTIYAPPMHPYATVAENKPMRNNNT